MFSISLETAILATAGAVAAAIAGVLYRRGRSRIETWRTVTDEEFLRHFGSVTEHQRQAILRERSYLARTFGVPESKLSPSTRISELEQVIEPVRFATVLGDLEDDLEKVADRDKRRATKHFPESIADLVTALVGEAAVKGNVGG
jgi:hypothetical protein